MQQWLPVHRLSLLHPQQTTISTDRRKKKKQQWLNIRQQKREYVYHESNGGTGRSDGTEAVAIAQNDRFGYAINGDSDMNTASYKIDMPLYCEGENIESVTYSINKGYFEISENITDDFQSAVESGKPLDENSNGYLNPILMIMEKLPCSRK